MWQQPTVCNLLIFLEIFLSVLCSKCGLENKVWVEKIKEWEKEQME